MADGLATAIPGRTDDPQADAGAGGDHTFIMREALVVAIAADGRETEYRLSAMNYVGRSDDNHIRLRRAGVSRRHALISVDPAGFRIEDLGSQNGTHVNGLLVEQARLKDGDRIELGDAVLRFVMPDAGSRR